MCDEEDMLMLSGIQHFTYCPRQWALIHMEQQWSDNKLTVEGTNLHRHADNPFYRQKCGPNIELRSVNIASKRLGLYGVSDIIELIPSNDNIDNTIGHPKYPGRWIPFPIEYKHGRPKIIPCDELQLVAQVMCLEEMYNIEIGKGAIYYAETRHRLEINITELLRNNVENTAKEMHRLFNGHVIPKPFASPKCKRCSLNDLCMPQIVNCNSVSKYLKNNLEI